MLAYHNDPGLKKATLIGDLRTAALPYVKEAAPGERLNGEWCQRFDSLCEAIHAVEGLLREHGRLGDS